MSGYTPGPWTTRVSLRPDNVGGIDHAIVAHVDGKPVIIGEVFQRVGGNSEGWVDVAVSANASLIAAAPEMLEALKQFEGAYPMGINPGADQGASMARAAIAKAEGRK